MNREARKSSSQKKSPPLIFYFILASIPVLFFVVFELVLHLVDYGYDYKVFQEKENGVAGMVYLNPDLSHKYFGQSGAKVFNGNIGFYKQKPTSGLRVFVLGGSTTQGFPYAPQASFPSHLQRRLELLHPAKTVEVINLGASAINSYTILDMLPEVLAQSPDLILLYAGHNEYYGALGAGSSKSVNPSLARLLLALREYRMVQLIENILAGTNQQSDLADKNLMQTMIGQSIITYGSETFNKGLAQYEANLNAITETIVAAGVPLIIGTLTSNLQDHRPFNADQQSDNGLSSLDYFNLGKEQVRTGKPAAAKQSFIMAKEYDGLRFRAPEEMNKIITRIAKQFSIPVADIENAFNALSPNQITGNTLMCDHLHPNRQGYFIMSKLFEEAIRENKIFDSTNELEIAGAILDSLLLTQFPYTAFDSLIDNHILLSGLGQYPFVPLGSPNPYQDILDNDGINFDTKSISTKDSLRTLIAANYLRQGDSLGFITEMQVFLSYFPYNESRYFHAINELSRLGVLKNGYPLLGESLKSLMESNARNKALGGYYKFIQRYDSAITFLNKAHEKDRDDLLVLLDLGFIYLALEDYQKSEELFSQVIDIDPENQEAFHQRSVTRFELKQYEGSIADITKSLELKPTPDSLSYLIRGFARLGLNDRQEACSDWQKSAALGSKQAKQLVK